MKVVEVSAADIARIAGVRASAVSNWRRRHEDFPQPVGGTDRNPRFALAEVATWLKQQGKTAGIPAGEQLWQAFDSVRGVMPAADALAMAGVLLFFLHRNPGTPPPQGRDAMRKLLDKAGYDLVFDGNTITAGLIDLLQPFDLGARQTTMLHAVAEAAAKSGPAETFDYLCTRFLGSATRTGLDATPPELAELMLDITGRPKDTCLTRRAAPGRSCSRRSGAGTPGLRARS